MKYAHHIRRAIAALTLAVASVLVGVYVVALFRSPSLEEIVKEANFDPLNPPTRLREPGSLYTVEVDHSYSKVCDPDPEHLKRVLQESMAPERVSQRLMKGKFNVTGRLAESLNAALSGVHGLSVTYKLSDVKVREVAMDELLALQKSMLTNQNCNTVVRRLLEADRIVCMGRQALRATAVFKVDTGWALGADAQNKSTLVDITNKTIANDVGSNVELKSKDEAVGKDLVYGIRLSQLCITLREATEPIHSPRPPAISGLRPVGKTVADAEP